MRDGNVFVKEPFESASARRLREAAEASKGGGGEVFVPIISGESDAATGRWKVTSWGPVAGIRGWLQWRKEKPWRT